MKKINVQNLTKKDIGSIFNDSYHGKMTYLGNCRKGAYPLLFAADKASHDYKKALDDYPEWSNLIENCNNKKDYCYVGFSKHYTTILELKHTKLPSTKLSRKLYKNKIVEEKDGYILIEG